MKTKRKIIHYTRALLPSLLLCCWSAFAVGKNGHLQTNYDPLNTASWKLSLSEDNVDILDLIDDDKLPGEDANNEPKKAGDATSTRLMIDNNLGTVWTSTAQQMAGMTLTVDLGKLTVIQRVFLTSGAAKLNNARALKIVTRQKATDKAQVVASGRNDNPDNFIDFWDFRFNPVKARFVDIVVDEKWVHPWSIAELEIYGLENPKTGIKHDAVILNKEAPLPLRIAARDLSYYLTALTASPVPVVVPAQARQYSGTLFVVQTPQKLPDYSELMKKDTIDYDTGKVTKDGKKVIFSGPTPRSILFAVYDFLDRQGVRWLFPDAHGDFVPAGEGIDLGMLPLVYSPTIKVREWSADIAIGNYLDKGSDARYLWVVHNRWNRNYDPEYKRIIGRLPQPEKRLVIASPHSFQKILPGELFQHHPEWFTFLRKDSRYRSRIEQGTQSQTLGKRVPYETTYGLNFCTSNPAVVGSVVQYIADNTLPPDNREDIRVAPMDSAIFCECDNCRKQDVEIHTDEVVKHGDRIMSDRVFSFVAKVAEKLKKARPNMTVSTLAYQDYNKPPISIKKLPDNVRVEYVMHLGAQNLPPEANSINSEIKKRLTEWSKKAHNLCIYSHTLLYSTTLGRTAKKTNPCSKMPITLLTALSEWFKFFNQLGIGFINVQSAYGPGNMKYSPWNFYAFTRLTQDPSTPLATIRNEFFSGYFDHAAPAMMAFYDVLEKHLIENKISQSKSGHIYDPDLKQFPPSVVVQMRKHLTAAASAAENDRWVVQERIRDVAGGLDWAVRHALPTQWRVYPPVLRTTKSGSSYSLGRVSCFWRNVMNWIPFNIGNCSAWHHGGFFDININGHSLKDLVPTVEADTYVGPATPPSSFFMPLFPGRQSNDYYGKVTFTWDSSQAQVSMDLFFFPEDPNSYWYISINPKVDIRSLETRFLCYPGSYSEPLDRMVMSNSQSKKSGSLDIRQNTDNYLIYYDKYWDPATGRKGNGPCALIWPKEQEQSGSAKIIGNYVVTRFTCPADIRHLSYVVIPGCGVANRDMINEVKRLAAKAVHATTSSRQPVSDKH